MKRLLTLLTQQIPRLKKGGWGGVKERWAAGVQRESSEKEKRAIQVKNKLSQRLHPLKENQNLKSAPIK